ncbi:MAG: type IV secretory system conjugative DNA transfer family protein [Lactococcus chungangensis]|uniref:Type IV secretory system conjugative DNA transfer family protein n=1 Tax=Pseudolactococcus chungangensis TaxID=451457 RepID=A0A847J610_9LACT|nr:type IV secretory system conjugative DNA transfer family protein [Lactococcus chungangensis]
MNTAFKQYKKWFANPYFLLALCLIIFFTTSVVFFLLWNIASLIFLALKVNLFSGFVNPTGISAMIGAGFNWGLFVPVMTTLSRIGYILVLLFVGFKSWRKIYDIRVSFVDLNKGTKGTSRFTTFSEVKEQFVKVPLSNEIYSGPAGVPIIMDPDRKHVYIDTTSTNRKVNGATQSGKTQAYSYPAIDLNIRAEIPDTMIINDLKGSMSKMTLGNKLAKKRFNISVLNFIDPKNSIRYNPFHQVWTYVSHGMDAQAEKEIGAVAYTHIYEKNQQDPKWNDGAIATFSAISLILVRFAKKYHQPKWLNPTAFMDLVVSYAVADDNGNNVLDAYIRSFPSTDPIRLLYNPAAIATRKQRESFYMILSTTMTNMYANENIRYMTSGMDVDFVKLAYPDKIANGKLAKPTMLFVVFPEGDKAYAKLMTTFYTQMISAQAQAAARSSSGKFDRRIHFLLEEVFNIPPIPDLETTLNVGLERGHVFSMIYQLEKQAKMTYGEDRADVVLGGAGLSYFIMSDDDKDLNAWSDSLGKSTVIGLNRSGDLLDTDKSYTEMEDQRDLLFSDELGLLLPGEWVVRRRKFRQDLENNPVRPRPIFAKYKSEMVNGKEKLTPETNMSFAYQYLFSDERFNNHLTMDELDYRENLDKDFEGNKIDRKISIEDLSIPHDLFEATVKCALGKPDDEDYALNQSNLMLIEKRMREEQLTKEEVEENTILRRKEKIRREQENLEKSELKKQEKLFNQSLKEAVLSNQQRSNMPVVPNSLGALIVDVFVGSKREELVELIQSQFPRNADEKFTEISNLQYVRQLQDYLEHNLGTSAKDKDFKAKLNHLINKDVTLTN